MTVASPIHTVTALKLFATGLQRVHDANWTGMDLFEHIKDHLKGRDEPTELLRKPIEKGLPYMLGCWIYDEHFGLEYSPSSMEQLDAEHQAWFLEDAIAFLRFHGIIEPSDPAGVDVAMVLDELEHLFDTAEPIYWRRLDELVDSGHFSKLYERLWSERRVGFMGQRDLYAADFGDRVVHDRQLCGYLAELVVTIGFDGDQGDGLGPRQWVTRTNWPRRIVRILHARDRGKCAGCAKDLDQELLADPHIDHIVSLAAGGCNDIVNLQLLCSHCNQSKGSSVVPVTSSVPGYIKRRS